MPIADQLRRGIARIITIDPDTGTIERPVYEDNGRGSMVATGAYESAPPVTCRVSWEAAGIPGLTSWDGGMVSAIAPYVLCDSKTDIRQGDILIWRGNKYKIGNITEPSSGGDTVCKQAPLTEIK
jgi:hypothetical protein